ncbi:MAG TPA: hypothetical protein PLZ44_02635 [Methanothrix sp.]|nr:hypothetical protein [Methanothrix sp.]
MTELKLRGMEQKDMGVSATKVVVLCIFLFLGMLLPGIVFSPEASTDVWNVNESDFYKNISSEDRLAFLVNYAVLAPSICNSQPWKFNISEDGIQDGIEDRIYLYADESRWLSVADADKSEMYMSLGCALENMVIAAGHFGYNCTVSYFPGEKDLVAAVSLKPGLQSADSSRLFNAITSRDTCSLPYEQKAISGADLQALNESPGSLSDGDVRILLTSDQDTKDRFRELVTRADAIQYSDASFKSELGHWISQGVFGPTGLDAKIAQLSVIFLDSGPAQAQKDSDLINSTSCIGFLITADNDSTSSIRAGRALERFWLTAASLGIGLQPMNQVIEVSETEAALKTDLSGLMPESTSTSSNDMWHVQQAFRLGYSDCQAPHSNRRPLAQVMMEKKK